MKARLGFFLCFVLISSYLFADNNTTYSAVLSEVSSISEHSQINLKRLKDFEDILTLATDTRKMFSEESFLSIIRALHNAAELSEFVHQNCDYPWDELHQLVKLGKVYGWHCEKTGDPAAALETYFSMFKLGMHFGANPFLQQLATGLTISEEAVIEIDEFFTRNPDSDLKNKTKSFFDQLPETAFRPEENLMNERNFLQDMLSSAKKHPDILVDMLRLPAPPEPPAEEPECMRPQRILFGAFSMFVIDRGLPPAASLKDDIVGSLISNGYLTSEPLCPDGGELMIIINEEESNDYDVVCSKHGNLLLPSNNDDIHLKEMNARKFWADFAASDDYASKAAECIKLYDEFISIQPGSDFSEELDRFEKRLEKSENILATALIPVQKGASLIYGLRRLQMRIEMLHKLLKSE